MGTRLGALATDDPRFEVVAAVPPDAPLRTRDDGERVIDAVIDFSSPEGAVLAAQIAVAHEAALLVGTTGLSAENRHQLEDSARFVPVMIAPNTSPGVAVLCDVVAQAARRLGRGYEVEIVEKHHAGKRDAPSGTALRIAEVLEARADRSIASERIRSIREGDVIGEHEVIFHGPGEMLSFSHSAVTRDLFAAGALRATAWLAGRAPGLYGIDDALAAGG